MDVVSNYHDFVRRDVFDALPAKAGRLLDFGGGIGATGAALKAEGRADYLAVADQVADQVLPSIDDAYAGDLEDKDFVRSVIDSAGPFDTILALDILEHLSNPWETIGELHRGLVQGGVLVASIPNVNHRLVVFPLLLKGRYDLKDAGIMDRTHLRWFALHGAVELMSSSGLQVEFVEARFSGRKDPMLNKISFGLLRRFFARAYVIRARRLD